MELVYVDGRDAQIFERFFRLRYDVRQAELEFPVGMTQDEARVLFVETSADLRADGYALVDGSDYLGIAWLDWPLLDNLQTLEVEIVVRPEHRRRGVGSQLLEATIDAARTAGRTVLTGAAFGDAETGEGTGAAFAAARGFVRKHAELQQIAELPLKTEPELARRADTADYQLVAWRNETPVEWQQRFAETCSAADADIPHGELSHEPMVWTAQRVRDADARRIRQGRRWHTTIALSAAGELAAYTQLGGAASEPGTVHQYETFVRREHRGRGLGIRVKLANLRALEAELDGPAVVHTLNAPTNTAMIRVNDQLGFRPVALRTGWERIL